MNINKQIQISQTDRTIFKYNSYETIILFYFMKTFILVVQFKYNCILIITIYIILFLHHKYLNTYSNYYVKKRTLYVTIHIKKKISNEV